jgi:hypothetical protein
MLNVNHVCELVTIFYDFILLFYIFQLLHYTNFLQDLTVNFLSLVQIDFQVLFLVFLISFF